MRHSTIVSCSLAFLATGMAHASMPPQSPEKPISAAAAMTEKNAAAETVGEARALGRAQDHAVKNYRHTLGRMAAAEKKKQAEAAGAEAARAQRAKKEAEAFAKAQDYAVKNYRRNMSRMAAAEKKKQAEAAAAEAARAQRARKEAEALAKAQDRVVAYYKRSLGIETFVKRAPRGVEKLTCFTGIKDRHARIGVQVVNGKVTYFAFYSKWKPRTCSIDAGRDGDDWEDNGTSSKVTFVDGKGVLVIHRTNKSYRFDFKNVDRMRYCGMDGKINGSLTVTRGERKCIVKGIMDGHQG